MKERFDEVIVSILASSEMATGAFEVLTRYYPWEHNRKHSFSIDGNEIKAYHITAKNLKTATIICWGFYMGWQRQ
jgi:hypothetical protein